jgi:hypothetical protein
MAAEKTTHPIKGFTVGSGAQDFTVSRAAVVSQPTFLASTITIPNPAGDIRWTRQNVTDLLSSLTTFASTGVWNEVNTTTFCEVRPHAAPSYRGTARISIYPPSGPFYWSQASVNDILPSLSAFSSTGTLT